MYLVCTCSETCSTGFRGVLLDANMLVPDAHYPPADQDIDRGYPDPATMEEAISRFMDGMEAQERCGFNDLHCLPVLGRQCQLSR